MMTKHVLKSVLSKNYCAAAVNLPHSFPVSDMKSLKGNYSECVMLSKRLLEKGEVIAIPTDTVYGLAVDARNSKAIEKLYEIKRRDAGKPIAICVAKISDINRWANTQHIPNELLNDLLPGPVTLIFERSKNLNKNLNPENSKVGIRIPKNKFILQLMAAWDGPLALTSANLSNEGSSTSIYEFESLWPKLGAVFDDGPTGVSKNGSTIVDLTIPGRYKIVRDGCSREETVKILSSHYLCPV